MRKSSATRLPGGSSPRGLACGLVLVLLGAGCWVAAVEAGQPAAFPEDLYGEWYVLVHYTDAAAEDTEQQHWDEAIWRIAPEGGRLLWSILSRVEFEDARGRFASLPGGRLARSLGAWTPDAAQRREIAKGLRVSEEGSLRKTLRGTPEDGYRSTGRMRADSASVIGYAEQWTIEAERGLPIFTREATMGAARVETAEGLTRFHALERSSDGRELRGRYARDEALAGVFRMIRMSAAAEHAP